MNLRLRHLSLPVVPHLFLYAAVMSLGTTARMSGIEPDLPVPPAKPAVDSQLSGSFRPTGIPDYTKMTGSIDHADLPIAQPEVLWTATSEVNRNGKLVSAPLSNGVVAEGVLYFGDDDGGLIAYGIKKTAELWSYQHGSRISSAPSVDREFVYCASSAGVFAVKRETGAVVWVFQTPLGASESTPLPVGDRLYFSCYDGRAYCVKCATGQAVWVHDFVKDSPPDPPDFPAQRARFQNIAARPNGSATDGKLFIQCIFDQSRVIAIDCNTGERKWTFQTQGWISPAPTIADGRVYIASQDKKLYCVDLASGKLLWNYTTPSWLASSVTVHGGQVFLPHHGGKVFQLTADTGKLIRILEPPDEIDRVGAVYSHPIVANKTLYFACGKGQIFAFDVESGEMRWKLRPSEDSELFTNLVTDGRLIFATSRQNSEKHGENAMIAIGVEQ